MGRKLKRSQNRRKEIEFLKERFVGRSAKPGCHEFIIVLDNLKASFNLGKIFRSAFVFGAKEIHVVGTKWFDPGPAKGALKYVPAKFFDSIEASFLDLQAQGYAIFAFDMHGEASLGKAPLPEKSAFIFGNEGVGISFDANSLGVKILSIPQFGSMESLNVSVAASIAMYEYVRDRGGSGSKMLSVERGEPRERKRAK